MQQPAANPTNRIVVGVDFTEAGDHAICDAVRLARQVLGSELHLTYVIRANSALHGGDELAEVSDQLRTKVDELRTHVTNLCAPPVGSLPFILDTQYHIRIGDPAEAIHQVAVDVDADLIVVGTHADKPQSLLPSIAEELVRNAHVPVLVSRPKKLKALPKTDRPDPARPGEDIHKTVGVERQHLEFVPRTTHISGLL